MAHQRGDQLWPVDARVLHTLKRVDFVFHFESFNEAADGTEQAALRRPVPVRHRTVCQSGSASRRHCVILVSFITVVTPSHQKYSVAPSVILSRLLSLYHGRHSISAVSLRHAFCHSAVITVTLTVTLSRLLSPYRYSITVVSVTTAMPSTFTTRHLVAISYRSSAPPSTSQETPVVTITSCPSARRRPSRGPSAECYSHAVDDDVSVTITSCPSARRRPSRGPSAECYSHAVDDDVSVTITSCPSSRRRPSRGPSAECYSHAVDDDVSVTITSCPSSRRRPSRGPSAECYSHAVDDDVSVTITSCPSSRRRPSRGPSAECYSHAVDDDVSVTITSCPSSRRRPSRGPSAECYSHAVDDDVSVTITSCPSSRRRPSRGPSAECYSHAVDDDVSVTRPLLPPLDDGEKRHDGREAGGEAAPLRPAVELEVAHDLAGLHLRHRASGYRLKVNIITYTTHNIQQHFTLLFKILSFNRAIKKKAAWYYIYSVYYYV